MQLAAWSTVINALSLAISKDNVFDSVDFIIVSSVTTCVSEIFLVETGRLDVGSLCMVYTSDMRAYHGFVRCVCC